MHSILGLTLSGSTVPCLDEPNNKVSVRSQSLVLGANTRPQAEVPADLLFVAALSGSIEFAPERGEEHGAQLVELLWRRKRGLRCGL